MATIKLIRVGRDLGGLLVQGFFDIVALYLLLLKSQIAVMEGGGNELGLVYLF